MQRTCINESVIPLYHEMWAEIATFQTRADVLSLRSSSTHLERWVDKHIATLTFHADKAPALLRALKEARHLNHINTVTIEACTNANFGAVIDAVASMSHAGMTLDIPQGRWSYERLDDASLRRLCDIAPASVLLRGGEGLSDAQANALADVRYPISILWPEYLNRESDLPALAGIAHLEKLAISTSVFSDKLACAFSAHAGLRMLSLDSAAGLSISERAITSIACIPHLETLVIRGPGDLPGRQAMSALAENRSVTTLELVDAHHRFDTTAAEILSKNTTLTSLSLSLRDGCGSLARMASLEVLRLEGTLVSVDDARAFAGRGPLACLDLDQGPEFEANALAVLASSDIASLRISGVVLTAQDIEALLANRQLRDLELYVDAEFEETYLHAIALAGHPTLRSLAIHQAVKWERRPFRTPMMSIQQRISMLVAWGNHRAGHALKVNF